MRQTLFYAAFVCAAAASTATAQTGTWDASKDMVTYGVEQTPRGLALLVDNAGREAILLSPTDIRVHAGKLIVPVCTFFQKQLLGIGAPSVSVKVDPGERRVFLLGRCGSSADLSKPLALATRLTRLEVAGSVLSPGDPQLPSRADRKTTPHAESDKIATAEEHPIRAKGRLIAGPGVDGVFYIDDGGTLIGASMEAPPARTFKNEQTISIACRRARRDVAMIIMDGCRFGEELPAQSRPSQPGSVAIPPKPIEMTKWIKSIQKAYFAGPVDYGGDSRFRNEQRNSRPASVKFRMVVDELGNMVKCEILQSEGYVDWQTAFCALTEKYGLRFEPAISREGRPAVGEYVGTSGVRFSRD